MIFGSKIETLLSAIALGVASGAVGSILALNNPRPPTICFQIGDIGIEPGGGQGSPPSPPVAPPAPALPSAPAIPPSDIVAHIPALPAVQVLTISPSLDLASVIAITPQARHDPPANPMAPTNETLLAQGTHSNTQGENHPTSSPSSHASRPGRPSASSDNNGGSQTGVVGAQPIASIYPVYPESSRRNGEQGTVELAFTVLPSGKATDILVTRSSGFPPLDDAAIRAVRRARFKPATQNGVPVECKVLQPFDFHLEK